MDAVLVVARVGLAAVFLLAAGTKLADMSGSREALRGFNVPSSVIPTVSVLLPFAEIASAALLLIRPTAQVGATLAFLLLFAFIGGIGAALRRGSQPDCHCFGQLHSRPAGIETIARNGGLAAFALFVLIAGPGPGLISWASRNNDEVVALASTSLLAIGLVYACLTLWHDNRALTGRAGQPSHLEPLEAGQLAPSFETVDITGAAVTSDDLMGSAERNVLVFTSATCAPCVGLLPELARWQATLAGRLTIHVVASGDEGANRRLSEDHEVPMLLDRDGAVMRAFGVVATPSALAIDETGRVMTPMAVGAPSIEGLIRVALKRSAATAGLDVRHVEARGP